MLRFSLRLAPAELCRGSIPVNAVEQNVFLLAHDKQMNVTFLFPTQRAGTWGNVQHTSRRPKCPHSWFISSQMMPREVGVVSFIPLSAPCHH